MNRIKLRSIAVRIIECRSRKEFDQSEEKGELELDLSNNL